MELINNWYEEMRAAYLYGIMAKHEKNQRYQRLFSELQEAALKQAKVWEKKIHSAGVEVPVFIPGLRAHIVAFLIKRLGSERIHTILSAMKIRGMSVFGDYHTERRHTTFNASSNLRAAVFGVNDGLISNMSLILGIAGASANHQIILLAGVTGLLAGACSMAAGEYVSVRSQREVFEYQIAIEKEELAEYPEEEAEELSLIYQARGVPKEQADKVAEIMIENPETGLNTLAREELGLNPDDLVSPYGAMVSSFVAFSIGALLPLLPFIFSNAIWDIYLSMGITALSLFLIGATLSLFTNKNPIFLGMRMLAIGAIAGTITFLIGKYAGMTV